MLSRGPYSAPDVFIELSQADDRLPIGLRVNELAVNSRSTPQTVRRPSAASRCAYRETRFECCYRPPRISEPCLLKTSSRRWRRSQTRAARRVAWVTGSGIQPSAREPRHQRCSKPFELTGAQPPSDMDQGMR